MATLQSALRVTIFDHATARLRAISGALGRFQAQNRNMMAPMLGTMGRLAAFGAGYVGLTAGMRGTIGAAIKFEEAFADVRKVVEANEEQFANMSRTIKKMSTELPLTASDIASLFAAAGEAGVATEDLKAFSEMAARVGIAFDMSAGAAGESLAKLKAQLGLSVAETGDMADAINHLSNSMASKAPQITDFMLRVGKFAEMGGFHRDQVAAIGSAMISAGAQAETAGTSMMNVVRKMTIGQFAKKAQANAAKALGLDLPTLAKQMQKDAPKALKTVLKAIAKAPKDQQVALLSQFFGDEARAFAPLVGNIGLLDQALDSVASKTQYAGSAFREYVARASTASNALQLLRNKLSFVFEGMGERWLPTLKEGIAGIGDVLDTLGERFTVFDRIGAAFKGFANGLGLNGGLRDFMNVMGDLLLGKADGSGAADALGRIFKQFQDAGKAFREFSESAKNSPVLKFLGDMSGYGFKLMLAAVGFGMLAGAVRKLASALLFLSGASTALSIIKTLGKIGGLLTGGAKPGAGAGPGGTAPPVAAGRGGFMKALGLTTLTGFWATMIQGLGDTPGATFEDQLANQKKSREALQRLQQRLGIGGAKQSTGRAHISSDDGGRQSSLNNYLDGPHTPRRAETPAAAMPFSFKSMVDALLAPIGGEKDIAVRSIPPITGIVTAQPSGVQQVQVTNPTRPNINMPITVYATSNADAASIGRAVGDRVRSVLEGSYADVYGGL